MYFGYILDILSNHQESELKLKLEVFLDVYTETVISQLS